MVTLEGKIRVPQPQREATLKALVEHVALTRAEDGCLLFDVKPDPLDPECLSVREAFWAPTPSPRTNPAWQAVPGER